MSDAVSDAYLWDRSGPADPDIARLERVLGTLRAADPLAPLQFEAARATRAAAAPRAAARAETETAAETASDATAPASRPTAEIIPATFGEAAKERPRMRGWVLPFAVAATLAIAAGNLWLSWHWTAPRASWQVSRLDGAPRVASQAITDTPGDLPVGEWLETDAQARARLRVPNVGRIDVEPGTRVGLLSSRAGDYRLRLDRGTLQALIWAAPGQFRVETPAAIAIDLGCAYTLRVSDSGDESLVQVTSGWVALDGGGRNAVVRAGATCAARRGIGPGTPYANDVSEAFKEALGLLDFAPAATAEERAAALDRLLSEARPNDAITLWHLLSRVEGAERDRVFDRLATFAPPPADVTRDGVRAGTADLLDRWWTGAKLGPPRRWR